MAVIIFTGNAKSLLENFVYRINQKEIEDSIRTWSIDSDGDFTHKSDNWGRKAWFRPVVSSDRLTFHIIKTQKIAISTVVYGYYHGHLIETFLNHFDRSFSSAAATALPATGDICS